MRNELADAGSCSPTSMSKMRVLPKAVRRNTLGPRPGSASGHAPDNGGIGAIGALPHGGQRRLGLVSGHDADILPSLATCITS